MTNTYFVIGVLEKDFVGMPKYRQINEDVEATTPAEAVDHFERSDWKWIEEPLIWLITEDAKMIRAGQPTLFPLRGIGR